MTLLLNRELVSRVKLCLISVIPDIVKDCPKIRNLPKIFLRSLENVSPGTYFSRSFWTNDSSNTAPITTSRPIVSPAFARID